MALDEASMAARRKGVRGRRHGTSRLLEGEHQLLEPCPGPAQSALALAVPLT